MLLHDLILLADHDGEIWMQCEQCNIRASIGYLPTIEQVATLATAHRTENP